MPSYSGLYFDSSGSTAFWMREKESFSNRVDRYLSSLLGPEDQIFRDSKTKAVALNKEGISLGRNEAEVLGFFIRQFRCKSFVEIGTLTAYSALWILRNLEPNGELWTFEKDPHHAEIAREILNLAQQEKWAVGKQTHLVEGSAEDSLSRITNRGPFDGVFIDANKAAYGTYLSWAKLHLKVGGILILDNVFLGGATFGDAETSFSGKQISVMNSVNRDLLLGDDFDGTIVPTPEGLLLAVKRN